MLDATYVSHLQAVTGAQWRPAVLPINKFVSQTNLQIRISPQVTYLVDAKLDSTISLHNQGVGVVKPELLSHPHAALPEQRTHFVRAHRLFCFQDFFGDRAGVFGVERNFALAQRLREREILGGQAAFLPCARGRKSGYQRRKVFSHSSSSTRVLICRRRCAPRWLHPICCILTIRLLTTC